MTNEMEELIAVKSKLVCEICQSDPSLNKSVSLIRINATGQKGIWRCQIHMPRPIPNTIPPMINPLGRNWVQPSTDNLLIDDVSVIMTEKEFDSLSDYTNSSPTGVYIGKMWKAQYGLPDKREWYLRWFDWHTDGDPGLCSNYSRKILIA